MRSLYYIFFPPPCCHSNTFFLALHCGNTCRLYYCTITQTDSDSSLRFAAIVFPLLSSICAPSCHKKTRSYCPFTPLVGVYYHPVTWLVAEACLWLPGMMTLVQSVPECRGSFSFNQISFFNFSVRFIFLWIRTRYLYPLIQKLHFQVFKKS